MTGARALAVAVLAVVVSGSVAWWSAAQSWVTTTRQRPHPLPPDVVVESGTNLSAWLLPSILVVLAAGLALVATRGLIRRLVAVVGVVASLGIATGAVDGLVSTGFGWPFVTLLSGMASLILMVWVGKAGGAWPGMSARYDRAPKTAAVTDDNQALWDALDRGVDPTSPTISQTAPGKEYTQ